MNTQDAPRLSRLDNGLTVITAFTPSLPSVSVGLWVGVGGRHEPAALNGVSHFIEHMLFKGTRRRSARQISEAVESVGGYLNAFTTEDHTCFYARAGADRFELLVDVLLDMFLDSTFDRREIDKERDVIKEELAMYLDQPQQHVEELLNETLWPNHPLGRPLTGTAERIDALTRAEMTRYQREHYVAAASVLAVAGNVSHAAVLRVARRHCRRFPTGTPAAFARYDAPAVGPRVRLATRDTAQMALALGVRACSRHDERRHALRLLNVILGENTSSRLFQILREDRALAYSIHSSLNLLEDTGALILAAGLDTHRLRPALRLIVREFARLAARPPTARELRQARDYLVGQFDLSLEGTENLMMWLGEQFLAYGRVPSPEEVKAQFRAVTSAQVQRVAREFLRPERLSLALVSPLRSAKGLARCLAAHGP